MRLGTHILLQGGHEILVNRPLGAMSLMCEPQGWFGVRQCGYRSDVSRPYWNNTMLI